METPKSHSRSHVPTPKMSERKKTLFSGTKKNGHLQKTPLGPEEELNILDGMMPLDFEAAIHIQNRLKPNLRVRLKKMPDIATPKSKKRMPLSPLSDSNQFGKSTSQRNKKLTHMHVEESPKRILKTLNSSSKSDSSADDDLGDLLKDTLHLRSHKGSRSRHNSNEVSDREVSEIMTHKRPTKSIPSPQNCSSIIKQPRLEEPSASTPETDSKLEDPNSNTDSPSTNKNYTKSLGEFSIPTKSFYSTNNKSSTISPISRQSRLSLPTVKLNKSPSMKKVKPKQRAGIRLARNVSHGIRRPKFKPTHPTIETILKSLKGDKFKKLLENREMKIKADEINKILKSGAKALEQPRSRNLKVNTNYSDDDLFSDSEGDDGDCQQESNAMTIQEIKNYSNRPANVPIDKQYEGKMEENTKPRKFFKSRKQGISNAFTINNIRGTVNKGRVSLLPTPKNRRSGISTRSKKNFSNEQATVKDIINWLDAEPSSKNAAPSNIENNLSQTIDNDSYIQFRRRIPYKTKDPSVIEQQELLLDFLISYDICNERNFEIFIIDPDKHKDEAAKVVDSLIAVKPSKDPAILSTSRDEEDIVSEMSEPLGLNFADSQEANSFRQKLPHNTNDPVVAEQQKTLLEFLIKNQICNEQNFLIFIAEPEKYRDEASKILQNYMVTSDFDDHNEPKSTLENDVDNCMSIDPFSVAAELPSKYVAETSFETSDTTLETLFSDDVEAQWDRLSPSIPLQKHQQPPPSDGDNLENAENRCNNRNEPKLFPIFYSSNMTPLNSHSTRKKSSKSFVGGFGTNQYQIDAGQKEFGAQQCPECGLVYTAHEPEEEKLHTIYHRSLNILKFKGWIDEDIVMSLPEWGQGGRIIKLTHNIHPKRLERVVDILNIIDKELGILSDKIPTPFVAFLAVKRNEIVGFSFVQPIKSANRYICLNATDYTSEEIFDVKCGIARIWVSPLNRRQRIATKLIEAIRRYTYSGIELSVNDIAFSSPTDDGKYFAQNISKRKDFLMYQSF